MQRFEATNGAQSREFDEPRAAEVAADGPATEPRRSVRRRAGTLAAVVVGVGAITAAVIGALTSTVGDLAASLPTGGHAGDQVAEPAEDAASDGLVAATAELHAHLNWLIWGPADAVRSPAFTRLADDTIVLATVEGEPEIATLVTQARDLLIRDGDERRAHDLLAEAERLAAAGPLGPGRFEADPDPQLPG